MVFSGMFHKATVKLETKGMSLSKHKCGNFQKYAANGPFMPGRVI